MEIINKNSNKIIKKIGTTTYEISLYFSKKSNDKMIDKIERLIENDDLFKSYKNCDKWFKVNYENTPTYKWIAWKYACSSISW